MKHNLTFAFLCLWPVVAQAQQEPVAAPTPAEAERETPATPEPAPPAAGSEPASPAPRSEPTPPAAEPAPAPALPPAAEVAPVRSEPARVEALTVVGTRESRTAGSAHVLRARDLERMNQDNPEAVVKQVPGVYTRGEDGVGLRPNIGIRGTNPDRSKKITLMEDGVLFGPAPYAAPAAYYFPLITRMEMIRVIKGPGAVSFGPQTVGGALDLVTRRIPGDESGGVDLAVGQYGYGKFHGHFGASSGRAGYVLEGVHLRSDGYKELDGGGDTGFSRNEWMWKGRYQISTDPAAVQELRLKLGYSDEASNETYLGQTDADFRANPYRRYRASRLDRMDWHRTSVTASYQGEFGAFTLNAAAYRHDLDRTWRKVNRLGGARLFDVLTDAETPRNAVYLAVLRGEQDTANARELIWIGPNHRTYVSEGVQASGGWRGASGPISHRAEVGLRLHYDRIDRRHSEDAFFMRQGQLVQANEPTLTTAHERVWANALALYAADAVTWGPLTLTPGARVELIASDRRDRLRGIEEEGEDQRVFIPGMGAYLALSPSLGLLAGAYRGFSPPEAGRADSVRSEKSVNYEAGARFRNDRFRAELIGFFNDYENLTSFCTIASGCETDRVYNAGAARIWGAEAFVQADLRLGAGLTLPLVGAYTLTNSELLSDFASDDPTLGRVRKGDELPYVPRHQATATIGLEHRRGGLAAGLSYVSEMREQAGHGEGGLRTDASFVTDITARAALTRHGELYLNLRNALGAEDLASRRPFGARPIAPRWLQVGTRWFF